MNILKCQNDTTGENNVSIYRYSLSGIVLINNYFLKIMDCKSYKAHSRPINIPAGKLFNMNPTLIPINKAHFPFSSFFSSIFLLHAIYKYFSNNY